MQSLIIQVCISVFALTNVSYQVIIKFFFINELSWRPKIIAVRRKYSRPMLKRDRQYAYNITMRQVRANIVALEKQLSINPTYSECVFIALVIQHAMLMRYIVMCGLPAFTIFFPHCRIFSNLIRTLFTVSEG